MQRRRLDVRHHLVPPARADRLVAAAGHAAMDRDSAAALFPEVA